MTSDARRRRHAKIVATLGPSSSSTETIRALFMAGVDVFRLNFSHGTHDQHREQLTFGCSVIVVFAPTLKSCRSDK